MAQQITAGVLLDLLDRAHAVIAEDHEADEHRDLLGELATVTTVLRREIGGSHMGTGADVVLIGSDDGELVTCGKCGTEYNPAHHAEDCPHDWIERGEA